MKGAFYKDEATADGGDPLHLAAGASLPFTERTGITSCF